MRRYEQIYILRPSLSEDEITAVIENTNQLILGDNGAIIYLDKWGMRKLAYEIKKEIQGYYVLCDFAATPDVVSEIERKFRIDESVLKYLTVKIADAISTDEIEAARSEAEAKAIVPEVEGTAEESPVTEKAAQKEEKKEETAVEKVAAEEAVAEEAVAEEPAAEEVAEDKAVEEAAVEEKPTDTVQ